MSWDRVSPWTIADVVLRAWQKKNDPHDKCLGFLKVSHLSNLSV